MSDRLTIGAALNAASSLLAAGGVETARLDARVLIAACLGIDAGAVLLRADAALSSQDYQRFEEMVCRRLAGMPVARILGRREFWGMEFILAPSSLIPRPDSETLVEAALDVLRQASDEPHILDLGTGPGTLLLALLSACDTATGIGVDRDEATLKVALENARRFGMAHKVHFLCADWGRALRPHSFDMIVSNPPYIRRSDIAGLAVEVREHDPRLALDGGWDGLEAYRAVLPDMRRLVRGKGHIALEIGEDQGDAVAGLMVQHGFSVCTPTLRDLAGRPRVVMARNVL